jgi:trehalose 6-phosphate phosphatase
VIVLRSGFDMDAFMELQRSCDRRLLMLDYDGTLAPFVAERMEAKPLPGVVERLEALMHDTRTQLAIVTGRSVDDIRKLLDLRPLPEIWGSHGWEHRQESGTYYPPELGQSVRDEIDELWRFLCGEAGEERLELKPASIAVHWRGLEENPQNELRARLLERNASFVSDLRMHAFDDGL